MASPSSWGTRIAVFTAIALTGLTGCGGGLFGKSKPKPAHEPPPTQGSMAWPAEGRVSSRFGPRGNAVHEGIDIAAPEGTPVRAAADGTVLYSGSLRGYGKVVILEHPGGLTTVYAHNRENSVQAGERVRRGDVIGLIGQTGRTTGPNLHFEVRRDKQARDPLVYLPEKRPMVAREQPKRASSGVGG